MSETERSFPPLLLSRVALMVIVVTLAACREEIRVGPADAALLPHSAPATNGVEDAAAKSVAPALGASAAPTTAHNGSLKTDGWTVTWNASRAWADGEGQKQLTVYKAPASTAECDMDFSGQVLSAVGSIVSYYEFVGTDCGTHAAHPSEIRRFRAVDLRKLAKGEADPSASLLDSFDRAEVEKALAADSYLKKFRDADSVCEYSLTGYEAEWAVYDRVGDRVAVRLGLPHGCEVMRGRLTVIGLKLAPKPEFADSIGRAATAGLLMKQLAPTGVGGNGD